MFDQLQYSVTGQWTPEARGTVAAENVDKVIEFSAPPEFHGEPGFWTPEHFLLAAVASCFITTFRAIAGFSKFDPLSLDLAVEGRVDKTQSGYDFTAIVLRPHLTIRDENERLRANRILEKTEKACLVARALKCEVMMEARIEAPEMQLEAAV